MINNPVTPRIVALRERALRRKRAQQIACPQCRAMVLRKIDAEVSA